MMGNKVQPSWKTCRHVCLYVYLQKVKFTHRYVSYHVYRSCNLANKLKNKKLLPSVVLYKHLVFALFSIIILNPFYIWTNTSPLS